MRIFVTIAAAAAIFFVCAPAEAGVDGTVIMAKAGDRPLFLWDCTPVVTKMVETKQPRDAALRELESDAMTIASERAATTGARSLTVRVVYQKTGAVSPTYGTATFEGVEHVFDLTVDTSDAKSHGASFASSLANGTAPKSVTVSIAGALPPY